jgi:polyferredoxin
MVCACASTSAHVHAVLTLFLLVDVALFFLFEVGACSRLCSTSRILHALASADLNTKRQRDRERERGRG